MTSVLITGSNRGIGLELCRQLSARGDEVLATCRHSSPELKVLGVKIFEDVEVVDKNSLGQLSQRLGNKKIDILINNAGILSLDHLGELNFAQVAHQIEVNALGPLKVTETLLPHLQKGSKVVMITSRMGSIADNSSGGFYGYRMSKAALNMAAVTLAHDLKSRSIAVGIVHPGMVATEMTGEQGIDPVEAVEGILQRIAELSLANSGTFWHAKGEVLPW